MWCPPARTRWQLPFDNRDGRDHLKKTSAKLLPQMLTSTRNSNINHSFPFSIRFQSLVNIIIRRIIYYDPSFFRAMSKLILKGI